MVIVVVTVRPLPHVLLCILEAVGVVVVVTVCVYDCISTAVPELETVLVELTVVVEVAVLVVDAVRSQVLPTTGAGAQYRSPLLKINATTTQ